MVELMGIATLVTLMIVGSWALLVYRTPTQIRYDLYLRTRDDYLAYVDNPSKLNGAAVLNSVEELLACSRSRNIHLNTKCDQLCTNALRNVLGRHPSLETLPVKRTQ